MIESSSIGKTQDTGSQVVSGQVASGQVVPHQQTSGQLAGTQVSGQPAGNQANASDHPAAEKAYGSGQPAAEKAYKSGQAAAQSAFCTGVDALVVGAGFAGAVVARELAERAGYKVLVLEQRPHIGGNAYDCLDDSGVLVHAYGPHIFHTNSKRVFTYLSQHTALRNYQHEVQANIHGIYTPVPFNFNSIEQHFVPEQAAALIKRLTDCFGANAKVPIIELRKTADPLLSELADFVYQNVFLHYTLKQWGQKPEEVDESVTARVPVYTGRDNRYFTDTYQGMPAQGYTPLFESLLAHPGIQVVLNVDAREMITFSEDNNRCTQVLVGERPFTGPVIYTGPLDFLAGKRFGLLPYRSLDFVYKTLPQRHVLPVGTVNYTVSEDYTRITEFTWLTGQELNHTTLMEEYPCAYADKPGQVPYYAILDPANEAAYQRYRALFSALPNFYPLGRLAEYRYYNMDQIVERALELADTLCSQAADLGRSGTLGTSGTLGSLGTACPGNAGR